MLVIEVVYGESTKTCKPYFFKSECIFRSKTAKFSVKVICADIVKNMLENCTITSNFKTVCYDIDPKVDSEISMNLLELILTLFVRILTFSFAKDVREKHKAAKKSSKKRSLRTEIKQYRWWTLMFPANNYVRRFL